MARTSWKDIAEALAERVANYAFCDAHPQSAPDPECPFCLDRGAYQRYMAAGGPDFRLVLHSGRSVTLAEIRQDPGLRHLQEPQFPASKETKVKPASGPATRAAPPGGPLSDPYARRNIAALEAIEIAQGALSGGDKRIYPALSRRGLVWEGPADCWHLTDDGSRALAAWDAERTARQPGAEEMPSA